MTFCCAPPSWLNGDTLLYHPFSFYPLLDTLFLIAHHFRDLWFPTIQQYSASQLCIFHEMKKKSKDGKKTPQRCRTYGYCKSPSPNYMTPPCELWKGATPQVNLMMYPPPCHATIGKISRRSSKTEIYSPFQSSQEGGQITRGGLMIGPPTTNGWMILLETGFFSLLSGSSVSSTTEVFKNTTQDRQKKAHWQLTMSITPHQIIFVVAVMNSVWRWLMIGPHLSLLLLPLLHHHGCTFLTKWPFGVPSCHVSRVWFGHVNWVSKHWQKMGFLHLHPIVCMHSHQPQFKFLGQIGHHKSAHGFLDRSPPTQIRCTPMHVLLSFSFHPHCTICANSNQAETTILLWADLMPSPCHCPPISWWVSHRLFWFPTIPLSHLSHLGNSNFLPSFDFFGKHPQKNIPKEQPKMNPTKPFRTCRVHLHICSPTWNQFRPVWKVGWKLVCVGERLKCTTFVM